MKKSSSDNRKNGFTQLSLCKSVNQSLSYLLGFQSSKGTKFYQSMKNNDLPINQTGYSETKEFVISTDEPSETKNGSTLKAQFYFDEPKK